MRHTKRNTLVRGARRAGQVRAAERLVHLHVGEPALLLVQQRSHFGVVAADFFKTCFVFADFFLHLGDLYAESGQTLQGSFSAGWLARLYRSQILQVNTRWKALAEIYTMHSFAPLSKLKIFVKIAEIFADFF